MHLYFVVKLRDYEIVKLSLWSLVTREIIHIWILIQFWLQLETGFPSIKHQLFFGVRIGLPSFSKRCRFLCHVLTTVQEHLQGRLVGKRLLLFKWDDLSIVILIYLTFQKCHVLWLLPLLMELFRVKWLKDLFLRVPSIRGVGRLTIFGRLCGTGRPFIRTLRLEVVLLHPLLVLVIPCLIITGLGKMLALVHHHILISSGHH